MVFACEVKNACYKVIKFTVDMQWYIYETFLVMIIKIIICVAYATHAFTLNNCFFFKFWTIWNEIGSFITNNINGIVFVLFND